MVGNLNDSPDLEKQLIDFKDLLHIDQYILNSLSHTFDQVNNSFNEMQFNKSVNLIESFFLTQLSSFYIKSVKDRLYCDKKDGLTRRSAQTALYHTLVKSLIMLGPIMPHLAEEAFHYSILKKHKDSSLFRSDFGFSNQDHVAWKNRDIEQIFELIISLREKFFELLKTENSALYELCLECDEKTFDLLKNVSNLSECFGCANLEIKKMPLNTTIESISLKNGQTYSCSLVTTKTKNFICQRCRKFNSTIEGQLCCRCSNILKSF